MRSAFLEVTAPDSLKRAWNHVNGTARRESRHTQGVDGQSLDSFYVDQQRNLANLGRDLRQRSFDFSELRPHLVPKLDGRDRLICIPTVRDRITQRAVLNFLTLAYQHLFANHISYGFVQSRSVQQAAEQACKLRRTHPWALKTDIASFFDTIDRERLRRAIRSIVRERSLHALMFGALDCEIAAPSTSRAARLARLGIRRGVGVRQGMPLSPLFANLFLHNLDSEIIRRRIPAVRYADDLLFFGNDEADCLAIYEVCTAMLDEIGLTLPPLGAVASKSVIAGPHETVEFLGLGLMPRDNGYVLTVGPKQIEAIRAQLYGMSNVKELLAQGVTLRTLNPKLVARCTGYLAAYECCSNYSELAHHIEDLRKSALRRLYTDGLGIDIEHASAEKRAFLAIS